MLRAEEARRDLLVFLLLLVLRFAPAFLPAAAFLVRLLDEADFTRFLAAFLVRDAADLLRDLAAFLVRLTALRGAADLRRAAVFFLRELADLRRDAAVLRRAPVLRELLLLVAIVRLLLYGQH